MAHTCGRCGRSFEKAHGLTTHRYTCDKHKATKQPTHTDSPSNALDMLVAENEKLRRIIAILLT